MLTKHDAGSWSHDLTYPPFIAHKARKVVLPRCASEVFSFSGSSAKRIEVGFHNPTDDVKLIKRTKTFEDATRIPSRLIRAARKKRVVGRIVSPSASDILELVIVRFTDT